MKKETVEIWIAEDGKKFETYQACRIHEMEVLFNEAISGDEFYDGGCNGIFSVDNLRAVVMNNPKLIEMIQANDCDKYQPPRL